MSAPAFDLNPSKCFHELLVCFPCGSAILKFLPVREVSRVRTLTHVCGFLHLNNSHPTGSKELSYCGFRHSILFPSAFWKPSNFGEKMFRNRGERNTCPPQHTYTQKYCRQVMTVSLLWVDFPVTIANSFHTLKPKPESVHVQGGVRLYFHWESLWRMSNDNIWEAAVRLLEARAWNETVVVGT